MGFERGGGGHKKYGFIGGVPFSLSFLSLSSLSFPPSFCGGGGGWGRVATSQLIWGARGLPKTISYEEGGHHILQERPMESHQYPFPY